MAMEGKTLRKGSFKVRVESDIVLTRSCVLCISHVQDKSWGFDFRRNENLDPTSYGQYSTELFTSEAENIIANHDTTKVRTLFSHSAITSYI